LKRRVDEALEASQEGDRLSRIVDLSILLLISLNVMAVLLETVQPVYQLLGYLGVIESPWHSYPKVGYRVIPVVSVDEDDGAIGHLSMGGAKRKTPACGP
jgi:hypothetical protein